MAMYYRVRFTVKIITYIGSRYSFVGNIWVTNLDWKTLSIQIYFCVAFIHSVESLNYLNNLKQKHSKVNKLKHHKLIMQPYFLPSESDISKDEIQLMFQIRSKVTKVKMNP